jgi:hypothetical protein
MKTMMMGTGKGERGKRGNRRWPAPVRALRFPLSALLLLLPTLAHAQAGAFVRLGFGARGIGLGGALVADGSGQGSPFYNPALAPLLDRQHVELSTALMGQDRQLQTFQVGTPMRPRAGIAAGLVHAGVTGIDGRDESGNPTGTLRTDEFAVFTAFGLRLGERLSAGLGLQVFRAAWTDQTRAALTFGLDAGVAYRANERLTLGLALDDALAGYTFDSGGLYAEGGKLTTDRFPTRLRAGATYAVFGATLAGEFEAAFERRQGRETDILFEDGVPRERTAEPGYTFTGTLLRVGAERAVAPGVTVRAGVDGFGRSGMLAGARPAAGLSFERPAGGLLLRGDYGLVVEPYGTGLMHVAALRVML